MMLLYFGAIRLLDKKKREFLQFLVMYLFALVCMLCISYIIARERAGENWHLFFHPIRDQLFMAAYYVPPSFLVSYLLYPFKRIKRNRILIWILAGYTLIVVGGSAVLSILVTFSNM
jgi:hypothetical protein